LLCLHSTCAVFLLSSLCILESPQLLSWSHFCLLKLQRLLKYTSFFPFYIVTDNDVRFTVKTASVSLHFLIPWLP
jgi:hypothetical protein